jgi:hypothetical protein
MTHLVIAADHFGSFDDFGPMTLTDICIADRRHIVEALIHLFAAIICLAAALIWWFGLRLILVDRGGRIRRIVGLWLEAKEQELLRKAQK